MLCAVLCVCGCALKYISYVHNNGDDDDNQREYSILYDIEFVKFSERCQNITDGIPNH